MLVSVVNDEAQIKHALPDMVVFRAGYGLHVGFDGNFLRERAVRRTFGALVTLPGPVLHVDSGVLPGPDLRAEFFVELVGEALGTRNLHVDRKSTRLNSSHGYISYAVFCLKKKKNQTICRAEVD